MEKKILFSVGFLIVSIVMVLSFGILVSLKPHKSEAQMKRLGSDKIDSYSICRNIANNGGQEIMVAYGTKGEWCSFILNPPPNVSVSNCTQCFKGCNCSNCNLSCSDYNLGSCP